MWYEDGNIKYVIEGVQSGDLGPAGNPYRLIKYVVVRPSRSDFLPLVDMRIRQISVTSGVRVPTEKSVDVPVSVKTEPQRKADGTTLGVTENENVDFDSLYDEAGSYINCNWLPQWWPTVLIVVSQIWTVSIWFQIEMTIDILGSLSLGQSSYQLGATEEYLMQQNPSFEETLLDIAEQAGDLVFYASTAWGIANIAAGLAINYVMFGVFLCALAAWVILMYSLMSKLFILMSYRVTNLEAGNILFKILVGMLLFGMNILIFSSSIVKIVENWIIRNLGPRVPWIAGVAKWIMAYTALLMLLICFPMYLGVMARPNAAFTGEWIINT